VSSAPREEIFLPVADERLAALFAPASEPAAGGDERGAMVQTVNALAANRQLGAARDLLEQWAAKWPDDLRFAKPLALLYATFGRATDAVRLLQRHIAAYPDDVDALGLGVEWLYTLHAGGAANSSGTDDLALARRYAATYFDRNGPERQLVQLWLDAMSLSPSR
jgi:predicted Zn-dependent protease